MWTLCSLPRRGNTDKQAAKGKQSVFIFHLNADKHTRTRRCLKTFTRDVLYLRIMLNGVGRLSSVSTTNVQETRRSYGHRLEISTLAKSVFWLCHVKMDITHSKSNIVRVRFNMCSDTCSFNRVCKRFNTWVLWLNFSISVLNSVSKLLQYLFRVQNSFSQQIYSFNKSTSDYS